MDYPENMAQAAKLLKQAVPQMVQRQLPANPINYALWYNYVACHIPELNDALDRLHEGNIALTPAKCKQLFLNHVVKLDLETQQRTMGQLTQLTSKLLTQLTASADGSSHFDDTLQQHIQHLQDSSSIEDINELLHSLIASSQAMSKANQQFQQQINAANEELAQLRQQLQAAQEQAYIDTLTQLFNRLAFNEQLNQLISNPTVAQRTCLILADIDHFKSFNDNYGHLIGDRVLQKMGEIITDYCPDNCIGARYGGEEFAVIVNNSSMEQAAEIAQILRQRLRQLRVKVKSSEKVLDNISASFGVAQYLPQESANSFIERADKALYAAKGQGRDCVVCFDDNLRAALA